MKKEKLKGKIAEKGLTQLKCAEALDITLQAFNAKLNGSVEFKVSEASTLSKILDLTNEERSDIFLD